MQPPDASDVAELIPKKGLAKDLHASTKTVERYEKDPKLNFPKSILIKGRRFYIRLEYEAWKRALIAASRQGAA